MAFVALAALVAVSAAATAATQEPDLEDAAPGAAVSRGEGPPPTSRGAVPTLSAEDRARSAKGLVDLNGNGLSDGLEDSLAGLAANAQVDVIVTFSGPGNAASAQAAVGAFSVRYEYNIIDGFAATLTAGQARALATAPGVFRVEEDATVYAFMESARPDFGVEDVAVDPDTAGLTGSGVTICMVDTGIQGDHEAFNTYDGETITGSRIVGFQDFTGDMSGVFHDVPYDYNGHGTHTAATAAGGGAAGPTSLGGDTVYAPKARGVAPGASLLIAKVLKGDGTGADSGVLAGIEWCVEQGADIISASLGIPGNSLCTDAVCEAMDNAALAGILPVVAAGNEGDLPESIGSPAASPLSLTVAAAADFSANPADLWATSGVYLAPFSSLGPTAKGEIKPDIAAPGVTILSAWSDEYVLCDPLFGCFPEPYSYGCGIGCYTVVSGTSMATPYVSGVAALMLQVNPSLTPAQIKQIIAETAHDRLTPGKDVAYGHGLIDALAAVKRAMGYAEGSYTPNELPSYFVGTDSVPDNGYTDIPITVTDTSLPLAVSITIDGDVSCVAMLFGQCLGYGWDPDLEMDLYTSNAAGDLGVLAFSSGCPAIGDCGVAGQRETAYVPANVVTTHYLARIYGWDGDPNFGKGGTFTYEISNGVDSRGGGPAPNAPPAASFSVNCTDLSCSFTDTSTDGDGTIASWSWDFGDGNTSPGQSPGHSYAAAGTYTVGLTVTDNDSASDATSQSVSVSEPAPNTPPVADAGPDKTVTLSGGSATVTLDGSNSYDPDGAPLTTFGWTILSQPGKATPVLSFNSADGTGSLTTDKAGKYTLELTVSDGIASSSDTTVVTVKKPPKTSDGGGTGGCNPKSPKCTSPG
ncbi:MAG: S8 family serine peptidase [Alphaproteobacteria bacterium]|nr:S8 family serine peptidase [Alphaproteobacteria bacterium]